MRERQPQPAPVEGAPEVPIGLSAIALPELGKKNQLGNFSPIPEDEALSMLNLFLEGLNRQGVYIVTVFDLEVDVGEKPGFIGTFIETIKVAIVRKP